MKSLNEEICFCNNLTVDDCFDHGNVRPFNKLREWIIEDLFKRANIKKQDFDEFFSS